MENNLRAFLHMLKVSELGVELLAVSDRGYNVIVGSTAKHPDLMTTYADHPRKVVSIRNGKGVEIVKSSAAGAYQILARYYDAYRQTLKLPNFSPASQDAIALQMIREQHATEDILAGRFDSAVDKCRNIWASLPGAGYPGQKENKLSDLRKIYLEAAAGGVP